MVLSSRKFSTLEDKDHSLVRILAGTRDFFPLQIVQTGSGPQKLVTQVRYRGYSGRSVMLTTRLRLAPRLRISRYLPLLPTPMPSWRGKRYLTFLPLRCPEMSPIDHSLARRQLPDNSDTIYFLILSRITRPFNTTPSLPSSYLIRNVCHLMTLSFSKIKFEIHE